ncbi:MAG TPA: hypothetical protein VLJ84_13965 [Usitatibacter sp.]|nr:hypothetical protein [Usitatibacter sp.]HST02759.1 hypothetical protein [Usitatibacter sp.]
MARKPPTFNAALEPLTGELPREAAAAVGNLVARHMYLDWLLGQVMYDLMEISIKQGRVIMKLPRPGVFVAAVKDLFDFHGLDAPFDFDTFAEKLEAAHVACRELTRSVYMADDRGTAGVIHLVRSPWDPGPGGHLQPETQRVDAKMLATKRREVEDAISSAEKLRALTDKLLRDSHAKRARPGFDRRRK